MIRMCAGNYRFYSDYIANLDIFWQKTLWNYQLKLHLACVTNTHLGYWLYSFLLLVSFDTDFRLLSTCHYCQHILSEAWLAAFDFDYQIILAGVLRNLTRIDASAAHNSRLLIHDKLLDLIQVHVKGAFVIKVIFEIVLKPRSVLAHHFFINRCQGVLFGGAHIWFVLTCRRLVKFTSEIKESFNSSCLGN